MSMARALAFGAIAASLALFGLLASPLAQSQPRDSQRVCPDGTPPVLGECPGGRVGATPRGAERRPTSPDCGARIDGYSGIDTIPMGGVDALLNPSNSDCAFGAYGAAVSLDVLLCPNAAGVTTYRVRRTSESISGGNFRAWAPLTVSAAGAQTPFRPIGSATTFNEEVVIRTSGPLSPHKIRVDLPQGRSGNFRFIICSIDAQ
jgi:hypothetical protein